jgi:Protein of unknown function (DUF2946)
MLRPMRRGRRLAVAVSLLAALLMAAQPLISALSQTWAIANDAALTSVVICTAHGAVTLSDEADGGKGPPAQKPPNCPVCVLGCGVATPKALLAGGISEPLLTNTDEVLRPAFDFHQASGPLLRLVTAPPRAPPHV